MRNGDRLRRRLLKAAAAHWRRTTAGVGGQTAIGRASRGNVVIAANVGGQGTVNSVSASQGVRVAGEADVTAEAWKTRRPSSPSVDPASAPNARGKEVRTPMAHQKNLTEEEIAAQNAADLPDREAMSLINANVAAPINAAVAANVLSDGAVAWANATQDVTIDQSTNTDNTIGRHDL